MLKSKKAIYVLLPLVLIVWGLILYKVFTGLSDGPDLPVYSNQVPSESVERATEPDTFSIHANYRDPFLGKLLSKKPVVKKSKKPKKVLKKPPVVIRWPSITYGGMVRNQQSQKMVAMVKISGKDNLMKEGEELDGIQLVKVYRDSIQLGFQGEKKMITK